MWLLMELFFVLVVLDVGNVGVNEKWVPGIPALKKELFLFLKVDRLELLEAGRKISFLLIFLCLFRFLRFCLLLIFVARLSFLFFFDLLFHLFLDRPQIIHLFLTGLVVNHRGGRVRVVLAQRFRVVGSNFDFVSRMRSAGHGGLFVPIQYN
jgi:hypothetical protein